MQNFFRGKFRGLGEKKMKRNAEKNRLDRLQLAKHKEKKTQINYIEKKIEEESQKTRFQNP